ncbi:MAG: LON peptidase substrate-binding domain-containing protein, partial [Prevotella sp.]
MNNKYTSIQMIADYEGDINKLLDINITGDIPILATRNLVLFPGILMPVLVGREPSVKLIKKLQKNPDTIFGIFSQKDENVEYPVYNDLYNTGVYAKIVKVVEMPGAEKNVTAIIQGLGRCELEELVKTKPYYVGKVAPLAEDIEYSKDAGFKALYETVLDTAKNYIRLNEDMPDEAQFALDNIHNEVLTINYVCSNLPFEVEEKIRLIKAKNIQKRALDLLKLLDREIQLMKIKQDIFQKTRTDIEDQQKEYFLQQQIKNIKQELGHGDNSPETHELLILAKNKKWSPEASRAFYKELDKLEMCNPQSPEYSVLTNYLQNLVSLPWGLYTKDDLNINRAQRVLDHDHYGMEKVKERILEYISVLKLRGNLKSPIICLYGPPGVGKTSLGKSIAESLHRKYVRVSLGGVHDESEIRGHR